MAGQPDAAGRDPILRNRNDMIDPWGQPFRYDPAGPRNNGKRPDMWCVVPQEPTTLIGYW
jgi:hypothetical protein